MPLVPNKNRTKVSTKQFILELDLILASQLCPLLISVYCFYKAYRYTLLLPITYQTIFSPGVLSEYFFLTGFLAEL